MWGTHGKATGVHVCVCVCLCAPGWWAEPEKTGQGAKALSAWGVPSPQDPVLRGKKKASLLLVFWILQGGHKLPRNEIVQLNIFRSSSLR